MITKRSKMSVRTVPVEYYKPNVLRAQTRLYNAYNQHITTATTVLAKTRIGIYTVLYYIIHRRASRFALKVKWRITSRCCPQDVSSKAIYKELLFDAPRPAVPCDLPTICPP